MFRNLFGRKNKENKALLEHKLYLAKENPELIFDLSGCGIHNVPSGIFLLCKVFRKQVLDLSENNLQSLDGGGSLLDLAHIVILQLNNNCFATLPCEIQLLQNLKELHLEGNQLKKLPLTLCTLVKLEKLNVNNNNLQELPEDLGLLVALRSLWVKHNTRLYRLPHTLHKAHALQDIQLDTDVVIYPPKEVTCAGSGAIRKYLCIDNGCDCYHREVVPCEDIIDSSSVRVEADAAQNPPYSLHIEEQKQKDFLAIEREWSEIKRQELTAANAQKINKDKLLAQLKQQQGQIDTSLDKLQQVKDAEKFRLVEQLKETENAASHAIRQLLQFNFKPPPQLFEQEMREHEELLKAANAHNNVRKAQILTEMGELLDNERKKWKQIDQNRVETTKTILNQEMEANCHVLEVLEAINVHNRELTNTLRIDDTLQKMAVAALLEKSDVRSWSLVQQVQLVESQLATLTSIELDRRKLQVHQNLNDLAQQRVNLSNVLLDLLEQQRTRRTQLMSALQDLELMNEGNVEDFWIRQYQALLDRMPGGLAQLQKDLNPIIVELLLMEGVLNYLPLLAKLSHPQESLTHIVEQDLVDLGVTNVMDRAAIIRALSKFTSSQVSVDSKCAAEASAPEAHTASAPLPSRPHNIGLAEVECVICMDEPCQVVYIPCGHYCTCYQCSITILSCPMCRANIERIIKVIQ